MLHPHQTNEKPSLPSIQFLLSTLDQPKRQHNRQSASISSLPSELQQLSLTAPATTNVIIPENHQPSWMTTTSNTTTATQNCTRRPPGASHTRSTSTAAVGIPPLPHFPSSSVSSSSSSSTSKYRHRRTVSATTTIQSDLFSNNLPYISEQVTRALTDSPPPPAKFKDSPQQKQLDVALNLSPDLGQEKPEDYEKVLVARDEHTGRYYCPFCNKAFNRPSSLRIHTYSHTGEKPFVCQEEGCGRQFSVQSNMRRHLRVHRLGRSKK